MTPISAYVHFDEPRCVYLDGPVISYENDDRDTMSNIAFCVSSI